MEPDQTGSGGWTCLLGGLGWWKAWNHSTLGGLGAGVGSRGVGAPVWR